LNITCESAASGIERQSGNVANALNNYFNSGGTLTRIF